MLLTSQLINGNSKHCRCYEWFILLFSCWQESPNFCHKSWLREYLHVHHFFFKDNFWLLKGVWWSENWDQRESGHPDANIFIDFKAYFKPPAKIRTFTAPVGDIFVASEIKTAGSIFLINGQSMPGNLPEAGSDKCINSVNILYSISEI